MNIRFTSSLTTDDENRIAPAVLQALSSILNMLPIAYMIRIDTSDSKVYQLSGTGPGGRRGTSLVADSEVTDTGRGPWQLQSETT